MKAPAWFLGTALVAFALVAIAPTDTEAMVPPQLMLGDDGIDTPHGGIDCHTEDCEGLDALPQRPTRIAPEDHPRLLLRWLRLTWSLAIVR